MGLGLTLHSCLHWQSTAVDTGYGSTTLRGAGDGCFPAALQFAEFNTHVLTAHHVFCAHVEILLSAYYVLGPGDSAMNQADTSLLLIMLPVQGRETNRKQADMRNSSMC